MSSEALKGWQTTAQDSLAQIRGAHSAIGGSGRGRRYATLQVNHAYVVLLSSFFQRFCRDLHSEAIDHLVDHLATSASSPTNVANLLRTNLSFGRKLDRGNPEPGNLGADFGRLGMQFWPAVNHLDARNASRQLKLRELNESRNAIAHQDWTKAAANVRLVTVTGWHSNCDALASNFDRAVRQHLTTLLGRAPW